MSSMFGDSLIFFGSDAAEAIDASTVDNKRVESLDRFAEWRIVRGMAAVATTGESSAESA